MNRRFFWTIIWGYVAATYGFFAGLRSQPAAVVSRAELRELFRLAEEAAGEQIELDFTYWTHPDGDEVSNRKIAAAQTVRDTGMLRRQLELLVALSRLTHKLGMEDEAGLLASLTEPE